MHRFDWSRLNHLQVGRYSEYFVKMEFTLYGFQVYSTEVDDRCVDFVVRRGDGRFYEVQVKSTRDLNYMFVPKERFGIAPDRLIAAVVLEQEKEPQLFILPMTAWAAPNTLLVSRDYEGKKSKPEWGLNLSRRNLPLLEPYRFEKIAQVL